MSKLPFKELNAANWLEADRASAIFATAGRDWLQRLLQPKLEDTVPVEIHHRFEVARGALAYGYFFYPLYTLAVEQLYRVVEAAVSRKYQDARGPKPDKAQFEKKIDWLFDAGILTDTFEAQTEQAIKQIKSMSPESEWEDTEIHVEGIRSERKSWHAIRHLRNYASHPQQQTIRTPIDALRCLKDVATKINALFV